MILTNASPFTSKKIRYAKTTIRKKKDKIAKIYKAKDKFSAIIMYKLKNQPMSLDGN
ncbi:MAG TPA: hypothetical protein VIG05_06085 [Candidatus Nitrosotenuis sp.]